MQSTEGYLSGQMLSEQLKVSRTAVWKAIQGLEADGFEIEAIRNKGYRLVGQADVLTKESCMSRLQTSWLGQQMQVFDVIDSTNTRLKQQAEAGAVHGTVMAADSQSAGRGRLGRSWVTPPGSALAFSVLVRPEISPAKASMLTLAAALAVSEAVDEMTGLQTKIKWPNDIVHAGKKICGILTEMSADMDQVHYVVIGIGLNVSVTEFPEEISATATSLKLETGAQLLRSELLARILGHLEKRYEQFIADQGISGMRAAYEERLANLQQRVKVLDPAGSWEGTCLGIGEDGSLIVTGEDGSTQRVIAGEVSVRGIYGYV